MAMARSSTPDVESLGGKTLGDLSSDEFWTVFSPKNRIGLQDSFFPVSSPSSSSKMNSSVEDICVANARLEDELAALRDENRRLLDEVTEHQQMHSSLTGVAWSKFCISSKLKEERVLAIAQGKSIAPQPPIKPRLKDLVRNKPVGQLSYADLWVLLEPAAAAQKEAGIQTNLSWKAWEASQAKKDEEICSSQSEVYHLELESEEKNLEYEQHSHAKSEILQELRQEEKQIASQNENLTKLEVDQHKVQDRCSDMAEKHYKSMQELEQHHIEMKAQQTKFLEERSFERQLHADWQQELSACASLRRTQSFINHKSKRETKKLHGLEAEIRQKSEVLQKQLARRKRVEKHQEQLADLERQKDDALTQARGLKHEETQMLDAYGNSMNARDELLKSELQRLQEQRDELEDCDKEIRELKWEQGPLKQEFTELEAQYRQKAFDEGSQNLRASRRNMKQNREREEAAWNREREKLRSELESERADVEELEDELDAREQELRFLECGF